MEKCILEQYIELKTELKDLRNRIQQDEQRLERIKEEGTVSDTVRGTRRDGTIGPIKITGYPIPEYGRVESMIKKRVAKLRILEDELQNAVNAVDEFITEIPRSDLRMMFRFRYMDDMTWAAVAINMNLRFPERRMKYTEDSCRMRHDRYLKEKFEEN